MKESQQVEWKISWRDDYFRWICGFANAEGGSLLVGRDDRGVAEGSCQPDYRGSTGEVTGRTSVETSVETPVDTRETPVETPVRTPIRVIARAIGESLKAVERATAKLAGEARLRYVGSRKGGHWETLE